MVLQNLVEGNKWILSIRRFCMAYLQGKFMDNVEDISDLKLRLSYGVIGNQAIARHTSHCVGLDHTDKVFNSSQEVNHTRVMNRSPM